MRVACRTDASLRIGTGHVMRCLTLADGLRQRGAECLFVCREHEGHLIDHIRSRGYAVHALIAPQEKASLENGLGHADWLGVDWETDAAQTSQALDIDQIDWLVVDHYALDHRWESAVRPASRRLMVIDDLADRRHDCDVLLDQNYGSSVERYFGLVSADCIQLHGPEFALIKPIYAERRAALSARNGVIDRVLIYFGGGSDLMNLTGMALREFYAPELMKIQLDIVVGSSCAHERDLKAAAATRGRTFIHPHMPDLSELMVRADLAIGAGGTTTWERCCLGLPSIVISIADNQRPACKAMSADGMALYLGHVNDISSEVISTKVLELISSPQMLAESSKKVMKLVDGKGLSKVAEVLEI